MRQNMESAVPSPATSELQ